MEKIFITHYYCLAPLTNASFSLRTPRSKTEPGYTCSRNHVVPNAIPVTPIIIPWLPPEPFATPLLGDEVDVAEAPVLVLDVKASPELEEEACSDCPVAVAKAAVPVTVDSDPPADEVAGVLVLVTAAPSVAGESACTVVVAVAVAEIPTKERTQLAASSTKPTLSSKYVKWASSSSPLAHTSSPTRQYDRNTDENTPMLSRLVPERG